MAYLILDMIFYILYAPLQEYTHADEDLFYFEWNLNSLIRICGQFVGDNKSPHPWIGAALVGCNNIIESQSQWIYIIILTVDNVTWPVIQ